MSDERPRLSVVKGGLHAETLRQVRERPPWAAHPARQGDTDSDKLSRVTALLARWERMVLYMSAADDRELLQAAIDSIRAVIDLPQEQT